MFAIINIKKEPIKMATLVKDGIIILQFNADTLGMEGLYNLQIICIPQKIGILKTAVNILNKHRSRSGPKFYPCEAPKTGAIDFKIELLCLTNWELLEICM